MKGAAVSRIWVMMAARQAVEGQQVLQFAVLVELGVTHGSASW